MAAPRPVFHEAIGRRLVQCREDRGWSQSQTVDIAHRRKLPLGLGPLRFLEAGQTKHPDADVLRTLAALYDLSYEALVGDFLEANYGVAPGAPPAPNPRLQTLEAEAGQLRAQLSEAAAVAHQLVAVTSPRTIGATAPPPRRRRIRRGTIEPLLHNVDDKVYGTVYAWAERLALAQARRSAS